jgi:tartrate-resistant acid phosphatase type 5
MNLFEKRITTIVKMKKQIFWLLPLILALGCTQTKKTSETEIKVTAIDDALYFFTIGDWGRKGEQGQAEVADAMGKLAAVLEPEFIVSTGDNFYPNGVASATDPQWKSSFEDVYSGHSLSCDWWVVLGNHDYRGNAQAEIDYSQISRRWNMPSRYFYQDFEMENEKVARFIFIDTNPLNDDYYDEIIYRNKVIGQDTTAQLLWLDSILSQPADWKIVVGHHPLYTGGKRAKEENAVRTHLEHLLDKHQIPVYLAGHEHDLQYIKQEGHPTHHFVSGAGSEVRPTGKMEGTQYAESTHGFLSTAITADSLVFQFFDASGKVTYQTTIVK